MPALLLFCTCLSPRLWAYAPQPIEGRWDITVQKNGEMLPSWLSILHSGHKRLFGHFVGFGGSARPISQVHFANGVMRFSIPPQWEEADNDLHFEATLQGDSLVGTMTDEKGARYPFTGKRAPDLRPVKTPQWGKPISLFNGKNLNGWYHSGPTQQWVAQNGILRNPASGSNLISQRSFTNFKLHVEFRYPPGSNSGVYLRGRYEVQVEDSYGKEPQVDLLGAVYGFIKPTHNVAKKAGEWQVYDITLVGRYVTIVANGKTIVCNAEIPGITGGALNSHEGEPGPIMFQGDHGPVEFRNVIITPAL